MWLWFRSFVREAPSTSNAHLQICPCLRPCSQTLLPISQGECALPLLNLPTVSAGWLKRPGTKLSDRHLTLLCLLSFLCETGRRERIKTCLLCTCTGTEVKQSQIPESMAKVSHNKWQVEIVGDHLAVVLKTLASRFRFATLLLCNLWNKIAN